MWRPQICKPVFRPPFACGARSSGNVVREACPMLSSTSACVQHICIFASPYPIPVLMMSHPSLRSAGPPPHTHTHRPPLTVLRGHTLQEAGAQQPGPGGCGWLQQCLYDMIRPRCPVSGFDAWFEAYVGPCPILYTMWHPRQQPYAHVCLLIPVASARLAAARVLVPQHFVCVALYAWHCVFDHVASLSPSGRSRLASEPMVCTALCTLGVLSIDPLSVLPTDA